jgi:hypothetical protein
MGKMSIGLWIIPTMLSAVIFLWPSVYVPTWEQVFSRKTVVLTFFWPGRVIALLFVWCVYFALGWAFS